MKPSFLTTFLICIFLFPSCSRKKKEINYTKIATFQDNFVKELNFKANDSTRVLLIFPHGDDELTCAGLTLYLKDQGAKIHLLTMTDDTEEKEVRRSEVACYAETMGIETSEITGLINNSWSNVMSNEIEFWYDQQDSIRAIIERKIDTIKPHILISYDTKIGAYGHPEHRITAELVADIFQKRKRDSTFVPQKVFQSTLTKKMEDFLVGDLEVYQSAIKLTGNQGLPKPELRLNIEKYWEIKNKAGHCYKSQKKTLQKFFLISSQKNSQKHSKAFSNEYYTVLER